MGVDDATAADQRKLSRRQVYEEGEGSKSDGVDDTIWKCRTTGKEISLRRRGERGEPRGREDLIRGAAPQVLWPSVRCVNEH